MSSPPTITEPTAAEPTVSPFAIFSPSSPAPSWLGVSPEDFIPFLPPQPLPEGSPSLPPNSRTWVPAHLPRDTSWSPILWLYIIGFVQDIHCMMLLGEYSKNITISEYTFNVGFLNFAKSLQRVCQLRGAFVPGRRLVEAAWVARMSTYAIKECSASVVEHLNECLWQVCINENLIRWRYLLSMSREDPVLRGKAILGRNESPIHWSRHPSEF